MTSIPYISILNISNEQVKKLISRGIRSMSYSLINKANNEKEFLSYIRGEKILSIALTYGIQAHSSMMFSKVCVETDIKNKVDEKNKQVLLSYNDVSETIIMQYAINEFYYYKIRHKDKLQYEKQVYSIIEFNKKKFLIKAYIDAFNSELNTIIEFKTTSNSFNIKSTINKYNYDIQAFLYTSMLGILNNQTPDFEFFFMNKNNIIEIIHVPVNMSYINSGKKKTINLLHRAIEILEKNNMLSLFQIY